MKFQYLKAVLAEKYGGYEVKTEKIGEFTIKYAGPKHASIYDKHVKWLDTVNPADVKRRIKELSS